MAQTQQPPNLSQSVQQVRVGVEQHPVFIVDDFHPDPQALLKLADDRAQFTALDGDFYPGVKLPYNNQHYLACLKKFTTKLRALFDLHAGEMQLDVCCFSISNIAEDQLLPIQCVPHYDTTDGHQLAAVHYLCDAECGGTSFYRHRATNFEEISNRRATDYQKTLGRQATSHGLPAAKYIRGSTQLFEKIASVEARFNRIIFYRSSVLHSGDLNHLKPHSGMSNEARLTITSNLVFGNSCV